MLNTVKEDADNSRGRENIAYLRQMLGELRQVAHAESADLLCYFIEMAYLEAGDIQTGLRPPSIRHRK